MRQHVKSVHDKIKDLRCDQCSFATAAKLNLKYHVEHIHREGAAFACGECDFTASHVKLLRRHERDEHGIPDADGNYNCNECDYKCPTRLRLARHRKGVHLQIRDQQCELCDYACSHAHNLREHMNRSHGRVRPSKPKQRKKKDPKQQTRLKKCTSKNDQLSSSELSISGIVGEAAEHWNKPGPDDGDTDELVVVADDYLDDQFITIEEPAEEESVVPTMATAAVGEKEGTQALLKEMKDQGGNSIDKTYGRTLAETEHSERNSSGPQVMQLGKE